MAKYFVFSAIFLALAIGVVQAGNTDLAAEKECRQLHRMPISSFDFVNSGCLLMCGIHSNMFIHQVNEGSQCGRNLAGVSCIADICCSFNSFSLFFPSSTIELYPRRLCTSII